MSVSTTDMELDDRDRDVLAVLNERASNPYHIREETDLNKTDVNTVLNRLARYGYVTQVTRGLYEITEKGRSEVGDHD